MSSFEQLGDFGAVRFPSAVAVFPFPHDHGMSEGHFCLSKSRPIYLPQFSRALGRCDRRYPWHGRRMEKNNTESSTAAVARRRYYCIAANIAFTLTIKEKQPTLPRTLATVVINLRRRRTTSLRRTCPVPVCCVYV